MRAIGIKKYENTISSRKYAYEKTYVILEGGERIKRCFFNLFTPLFLRYIIFSAYSRVS